MIDDVLNEYNVFSLYVLPKTIKVKCLVK